MSWTVERSGGFEAWLKPLIKRFRRAGDDIDLAFKTGRPKSDAIPGFYSLLWKGRVASTDLQRGTSGSFRVIYFWDEAAPNYCCLAACYFKGDYENLPLEDVRRLFVTVKARVDRIRAEMAKKKDEKNVSSSQEEGPKDPSA